MSVRCCVDKFANHVGAITQLRCRRTRVGCSADTGRIVCSLVTALPGLAAARCINTVGLLRRRRRCLRRHKSSGTAPSSQSASQLALQLHCSCLWRHHPPRRPAIQCRGMVSWGLQAVYGNGVFYILIFFPSVSFFPSPFSLPPFPFPLNFFFPGAYLLNPARWFKCTCS